MLDRTPSLLSGGCMQWGAEAPSYSLFFAVMLDRDSAERAARIGLGLKRRHAPRASLRPTRNLHASLFGLQMRSPHEPSPEAISSACALGGRVLMRPFAVTLDRAETWGSGQGAHMVLTGGDKTVGLDMLHRRIAEAHGRASDRPIQPHVTLMYGAGRGRAHDVDPLTFIVRDFALVLSFVGQSRYEILARFPLAA